MAGTASDVCSHCTEAISILEMFQDNHALQIDLLTYFFTYCRWWASARPMSTWTHTATTSAVSSAATPKAGASRTMARHSHAESSPMWLVLGLARAASSEFILTLGLEDSLSTRTGNRSVIGSNKREISPVLCSETKTRSFEHDFNFFAACNRSN